MCKSRLLFSLLLYFCLSSCYALDNYFYILRGTEPTPDMQAHAKVIDMLIAQAYHTNSEGKVVGYINPSTIVFSEQNHIKLMALVTNSGFNPETVHQFLSNRAAQQSAIEFLVGECQRQHLAGVQFDFEGVSINDSIALTRFFRNAYFALHKNGFKVSYAIIPSIDDKHEDSAYAKRRHKNWTGVYNLKELGKFSDFVTIMTYDQHQDGTTPGPFAAMPWVEAATNYALKYIPRHKLSLGVPTYSGYWYLGTGSNKNRIAVQLQHPGYPEVVALLQKYHINLQWDDLNKLHYAIFQRHWMNEYLYVADARSFNAKLDYAKRKKLRGMSVFRLGNEDPAIWDVL